MWKFLVVLVLVLGLAGPAGAAEYRLQVANLYRDGFVHYLDGPIGSKAVVAWERRRGADRSNFEGTSPRD
jgi:hypothetical protein